MPLLENFEKQGSFLFRHRGVLPLLIVIPALLIMYTSRERYEIVVSTKWFRWYELFCLVVSLLGLFIRVLTVGYTPKGTSGRNTDKQIADSLNTQGIYSTVRHPLYLGNFFMWLGLSLMTYHIWFVAVISLAYWIYYERIMFAEEQYLRSKFGEAYLQWASRTPTFTPKFHMWENSDLYFNYKKVLRQEKTGVFALFLMFFLMDLVRMIEHSGTFFKDEWYWTAGLIFGLTFYFVLKLLKYKTNLLADPNNS